MTVAELAIGGMTCASCAARIERKLNRLDGVRATVNFATEKARVTFPTTVAPRTGAGGRASRIHGGASPRGQPPGDPPAGGAPAPRTPLALALAVPVVLLAMVPALQFPGWQWVCLALATPVVWGAWPFHRAAWPAPGTGRPPWTR